MSHSFTLTRRQFLGGLGLSVGAGLLAPLMNQVWAESQGVMPQRIVLVVASNGIETTTLTPPKVRQAINAAGADLKPEKRVQFHHTYRHDSPLEILSTDLHQAPALGSLNPGGAGIDLSQKAAVVLGLSNMIAGGGHSSYYGALSASRSGFESPAAQTIDAWLAAQKSIRQETPFDALRLTVSNRIDDKLRYGLTALGPKQPAPLIADPSAAYNSLFGSVATMAGKQRFDNRSELLDLAKDDVQRALKALAGSSPERAKLERYLQSLEELRQRQTLLAQFGDRLRQVAPDGPDKSSAYTEACPLLRLETQFRLATASLIGGLPNVVVLSSGAGNAWDGLRYRSLEPLFRQDPSIQGIPTRHTVCHEASANAALLNVMHAATRRHVEMIAKMAQDLAAVPEGNGTMLDRTAIVFLSDNGDEHHSSGREWPILLVGGMELGLKTDGRAVVYPGYGANGHANGRQMSNLYNTLGYAGGTPLDEFGQEGNTRLQKGPLGELFG